MRCNTVILSEKPEDEIENLKVQNSDDIPEHQNLLSELWIAENQIESLNISRTIWTNLN